MKSSSQYEPYRACLTLLTNQITCDESFWNNHKTNLLRQRLDYIEPNDPYSRIDELIEWIAELSPPDDAVCIKPIVKAFYQTQYTFRWPIETVFQILYPVFRSFDGVEKNGIESSYSFHVVRFDQQIDLKTMQPVNEGTMVKQPFGVVILKGDKVLSKARVLCQ